MSPWPGGHLALPQPEAQTRPCLYSPLPSFDNLIFSCLLSGMVCHCTLQWQRQGSAVTPWCSLQGTMWWIFMNTSLHAHTQGGGKCGNLPCVRGCTHVAASVPVAYTGYHPNKCVKVRTTPCPGRPGTRRAPGSWRPPWATCSAPAPRPPPPAGPSAWRSGTPVATMSVTPEKALSWHADKPGL